jgi:hypothetical protein
MLGSHLDYELERMWNEKAVAFIDHPFRQTFHRLKRSNERRDIRLATQQHSELKNITFLTAVKYSW